MIVHASSVDSAVGKRFEQHPLCVTSAQRNCFRYLKVAVTGGYTEEEVKPPETHYYVKLQRPDGERESREIDGSVYDQLRQQGQARARLYNGKIISLSANSQEYATDLYPGGGTVWVIFGTIAVILSGALLLLFLLELFFG